MSAVKTDFIKRIRCLNKSIQTQATLNQSLADIEHNEIAKMLRNGLAVVGFATLEDFIKKRTSEAMEELSSCNINFEDLPDKIRYAATFEIIAALKHQLAMIPKNDVTGYADKVQYIQEQALKIASTATTNYTLSGHTYAHSSSNLNKATIGNILKNFQIEDPWRQMTTICANLGLGAHALDRQFENAAERRHRAAHVASADTPPNDISQFVKDAFAIAISFDALLSKSIQKYRENISCHAHPLTANAIEIRTIKYQDAKWKEFSNLSGRAFRTSTNLSALRVEAQRRSITSKQLYVEFDEFNIVNGWDCY
ncbi:HEPN domain-containing protein [Vibrio cyclitrophicus]|uniref:HEPN domain-containing protein n=1 Tax=Vibrio cyclitrophicus TaxID=47951 RepID=UPI0011B6831D|nr:HEPN domain-containing protein [Vibrio cyclitrophicus]